MKLTYEDKINLYLDKKEGASSVSLSIKYDIHISGVKYLVCLIDKHGYDIVKPNKRQSYSAEFKLSAINRVLSDGESSHSVSLDLGLRNMGILANWIRNYKENGYNVIERKRGNPSMTKKPVKPNKVETEKEELERLRKEVEYLKAELEYSKKLEAVVQRRKNRQQKKK